MNNQLLPCPFCGHDEPTHDEGDQSAWVQCTNFECGMCGPIASGPSLAAAAWNRRVTQPAAGEPVDGVEGFACWLIDHCEGYEIFEEKIQEWVAGYLKSEAYQRVAAPPAAAHGDEAVEVIATLSVDDYFPNSGVSLPHLAFVWEITPQRQRELVKTIKEPIKLVAMRAQSDGEKSDG